MGSSASLDRKPGKNWVEVNGELPPFVREIARAIERSGRSLEETIPIAISRIKKWASGIGVSVQVQAKAARALAQWNALKAKAAVRRSVKATFFNDLDIAADLILLTPLEDLLIQLSVEHTDQSLALSRVIDFAVRR